MNATAALVSAFLKGEILSIKTGYKYFGVTNLPREVGRSIERKFGVSVAKVQREGKSKYDVPCRWFEYRLPNTPYNKEGRKKMLEYLKAHSSLSNPRTNRERDLAQQLQLSIK